MSYNTNQSIFLSLPAGLAGQGMADLLVKVDGKPANIVKVSFK